MTRRRRSWTTQPPDFSHRLLFGAATCAGQSIRRWATRALGHPPREDAENSHFVPIEDRWRIGFPEWDRYGQGHPLLGRLSLCRGQLLRSVSTRTCSRATTRSIGQHTFFNFDAPSTSMLLESPPGADADDAVREHRRSRSGRVLRRPQPVLLQPQLHRCRSTCSTATRRSSRPTGGSSSRRSSTSTTSTSTSWASSTPTCAAARRAAATISRWRNGSSRRSWPTSSPDYDFVSVRAGSQPFVSDFRGFIFTDTNRARAAVRHAATPIATSSTSSAFDQTEKDTNSVLNTFDDRHQNTVIANYYRQDFIWPGYTAQVSFHYNHDQAELQVRQERLSRPARPGRRLPAARGQRATTSAGPATATSTASTSPRLLLGARPRRR